MQDKSPPNAAQERKAKKKHEFWLNEVDDFHFFMSFVESIYPDCRKFYKRFRPEHDELGAINGTDASLYRVFRALFSFANALHEDLARASRFIKRLPSMERLARKQKKRRKALAEAKKAGRRLASLGTARHADPIN